MPTLAPDHTPSDVAYASRQGQPAPVSPALAHQLSLAELHSEFAALKTQLAAQTAEITALKSENASLKSAIPNLQSDNPQSAIRNPQSEQSAIRNPQSGNLQSPSPANPAFAPLYAREVKHYLPGGSWIMPPIPAEALTRQAHLQRLGYLSTRCELALIEKVDRFAVCGIVGAPERDTYEFILHHLARLISIQKSLTALENDPTAPLGPVQNELTEVLTSIHRDPAAPAQSPSPSPSPSQSEFILSPFNSDQSDQSDRSDRSDQSSPAVPAVPAASAVPDTQAVPVIREVPQCPTFSPERLARTLNQTATALKVSTAGLLSSSPSPSPSPSPSHSPSVHPVNNVNKVNNVHPASDIGPLTLDPSHSSHASHPSHSSPSPQSPDPPCPKATANSTDPNAPRPQCTECDAQLCPSRIAVPIFTGILRRTQKCDGACRFCAPKRQKTCPYTLPKFRDGPKK